MNYQELYESICMKLASGGLKEVDLEQMRQRGIALLRRPVKVEAPPAAEEAPPAPKGKKG